MSVDVDAVNERLNGLVTLLKAVGVDGDDLTGSGSKKGGGAVDAAKQLNDEQIEAIIKKLQQAQAEAPQIIAALEAHAEARTLTDGAKGGKEEEVVEVEEEEEEEEDEEDDEFDEDANYPMVGHGVSDDISVVSDLTTPTVVTNVHVPEEEHYKDTLPPMIVGGGGQPSMVISAPKRKNLVSQVRPAGALAPPGRVPRGAAHAPAGGAAAARRKMYQETMTKLHENPSSSGFAGPSAAGGGPAAPQAAPAAKSASAGKPATKGKSGGEKSKKKSSKKSSASSQGQTAPSTSNDGWNSFDEPAAPKKKGAAGPTVIDDDGFLVGDAFDPFTSGSNPFKSAAGDLEFGSGGKVTSDSSAGFSSFDDNRSASSGKPRKTKTKKSAGDGEKKSKNAGSKTARRSRRASAIS